MKKADPLEEYKIASGNLHWYSNIRFAQLTLFFAITALIAHTVFENSSLPENVDSLMKLTGIGSCLLFIYLEGRADNYWSHFMERSVELEKSLGFKQYSARPVRKLRTTHAIRFFIFLIAFFWLSLIHF